MIVGRTKYSPGGGHIGFGRYANDQVAMWVTAPDGEREYIATVNLEELDAPEPGLNQLWIKTWSENAGVLEALIEAGVVTDTGQRFHCAHDAFAALVTLTFLGAQVLLDSRLADGD